MCKHNNQPKPPNRKEKREAQFGQSSASSSTIPPPISPAKPDRRSDVLALLGFAVGMGSWGWSVIAPETSVVFGSMLLFLAIGCAALAIVRMCSLGWIPATAIATVMLLGFGVFDWYVVIKPQRGKAFKDLLTEGYHINSECGGLAGTAAMPTWMRDQSKEWQAKTEQLISQKLDYKYSKLWNDSVLYGWVSDENTVSYQCTWLAGKVGAMETIISGSYDKNLKHRDYNGPVYWFEAKGGKVDITDALKNVPPPPMVFVGGKDGKVQITGHMPTPKSDK
jgi:hypothetical protein